MFAPLVGALRDLAPALARVLGVGPPPRRTALALDSLHVLDACDTAAVREGLLDDALLARSPRVRAELGAVCRAPAWADPARALDRALAPPPDRALRSPTASARCAPAASTRASPPPPSTPRSPRSATPSSPRSPLPSRPASSGTASPRPSGLSPPRSSACSRPRSAPRARSASTSARPWHAQLRPLVARLPRRRRPRCATGSASSRPRSPRSPIRSCSPAPRASARSARISARLAHATDPDAIVIDYADTDEAPALVTLLALYETRGRRSRSTPCSRRCAICTASARTSSIASPTRRTTSRR